MPELKPCPFCGGEATLIHEKRHLWIVECSNVNCLFGTGLIFDDNEYSVSEIIKAWNTRAYEEKNDDNE